jgi:hypothetical protein
VVETGTGDFGLSVTETGTEKSSFQWWKPALGLVVETATGILIFLGVISAFSATLFWLPLWRACASHVGDSVGFFCGFDFGPFVCCVCAEEGQAKQIWPAKLGIAGASGLGDLSEPECDAFPNTGANSMAVYPVFVELVVSHGQGAVVFAGVIAMFDQDTGEYPVACQAQCSPRWRFQHCG